MITSLISVKPSLALSEGAISDPLFAVVLLRRQAAAPSSAAMMRAKPVGVNHLRAFGFGHYLSRISELVSGVAGNLDFENSMRQDDIEDKQVQSGKPVKWERRPGSSGHRSPARGATQCS
jgi:hypothetical protein